MAERRMFAKTVVTSDAFLDMPMSARCLYFTLGMLADDDGFVNSPKSIIRQIGASNDDVNILITKKFVIAFPSGVLVIKHWRINNYLQSDRKKSTVYTAEMSSLSVDERGAYTELTPCLTTLYTECIQPVYDLYTQDRLDKNRLDKVSITPPIVPPGEEETSAQKSNVEELFSEFWSTYPRKQGKGAAFKSFEKLKPDRAFVDKMLKAIEAQKGSKQWRKNEGQFIPLPATWLNQGRWDDEIEIDLPEAEYDENGYCFNKAAARRDSETLPF